MDKNFTAIKLPYSYEFDKDDLEGIYTCNEQHGFAVVKQMLPGSLVVRLKEDIQRTLDPRMDAAPGTTRVSVNFIEESPLFSSLLTYEPYMKIARHLNKNEPITLNRTAAIYKKPGAPFGLWHTDWEPLIHPYGANAVLNNTGGASNWFYLNGTHPNRAGIAIIPDSHLEDWTGPEGFNFTTSRNSFYRKGTEAEAYSKMDFKEAFPLYTDPGDLIIFAERTYHGVFPHNGNETRLSCALVFRPKRNLIPDCWPLPSTAQRFISDCPPEVQPLVGEYAGIDFSWVSNE